MTPRPSSPSYGPQLKQHILSSFWGSRIEPIETSNVYRVSAVAVAAAMVLLPLLYVVVALSAVAAGIAFLIWRPSGSFLLLDLAVALASLSLLVFLFKPFFAGRHERFKPRLVRRDQEPILFAFLEKLASTLGAPMPKRLYIVWDVNASAGFRRGLASFSGDDLILNLGMPLVAGLTLKELAGVLAHELGHFTQGTGMRLSYLVRTVNSWFARLVFERDAWDIWLWRQADASTAPWPVVAMARFVLFMLSINRRILWLFMMLGHVVSCWLMRQMEFDADRHEVRLIGSETFEALSWRLSVLSVAHERTLADLDEALGRGRLADDFAAMIVANSTDLPPQVTDRLRAHLAQEKTSLFATHPAWRDRIANARQEQQAGLFSSDLPATVLFRDFPALSKRVSLDYYRVVLGPKVKAKDLYPFAEIVDRRNASVNSRESLDRFLRGAVSILRPLVVPKTLPVAASGEDELLAALDAARSRAIDNLQQIHTLGSDLVDHFHRETLHRQYQTLIAAGFDVRLPPFEPAAMADCEKRLQVAEEGLSERLFMALYLMKSAPLSLGVADIESHRRDTPVLIGALRQLAKLFPALHGLHFLRSEAQALAAQFEVQGVDVERLRWFLQTVHERLHEELQVLRQEVQSLENIPFDHADEAQTLDDFLVPELPLPEDPRMPEISALLSERFFDLYFQLLGQLCSIAEQLEWAANRDPLPRHTSATAGPLTGSAAAFVNLQVEPQQDR